MKYKTKEYLTISYDVKIIKNLCDETEKKWKWTALIRMSKNACRLLYNIMF